jgi:hypothetical protein
MSIGSARSTCNVNTLWVESSSSLLAVFNVSAKRGVGHGKLQAGGSPHVMDSVAVRYE